jgi:hypothetical protein
MNFFIIGGKMLRFKKEMQALLEGTKLSSYQVLSRKS